MASENEFILSKDGLSLNVHHWPVAKPSHILCIIPGLGEHGGRYQHVAEFLSEHNIAAFALDNRGHGLSEGKRGHTKSYEGMLSDIEEFLKHARLLYIDTPIVLYGHSMGGNLVTSYMLRRMTAELSGFILSSPFYEVAFEPPMWKIHLANLMAKIYPSLTSGNEVDVNAISRIPEEIEKYKNDTLVHNRLSVNLFLELMKNGKIARNSNKKIKPKGLVFHGDADGLVSFKATEEFVMNHPQLIWHPLPGGYHELHNDLGREKILEMLVSFTTSTTT